MSSTPPPVRPAADRPPEGPPECPPEWAPDRALTRAFTPCLPVSGRLRGPLLALREVSSTQEVCRAWARAGVPEGAVCLADHQTAGRGRRGRTWTASPGRALLWSCLLRPALSTRRWPELSILAGCAVADGVESVTGFPARLRWPNDVLVDGRKVAGILAEGVVGDDPAVILGIGINVHQTRKDWPPALRDRATSLAMLGAAVERETVLEAVLACLEAGYHRLLTTGFESVREAWRRRGLLGEPVGTGAGEGGTAEDLDPEGGLLVRRPDGRLVTVVAAGSLG